MTPRIRTIKPEFFLHEGLFELEATTGLPVRLAFIAIWTIADRKGRFKWRPRAMKNMALPYDEVDFSRVLDALESRGFLVRYTIDGEEFGSIPSWDKHQHINGREQPSKLPEPPEKAGDLALKPQVDHASLTRQSRVEHVTQGEGKGTEGKGTEGKGKEGNKEQRVRNASESDRQIQEIYLLYPRHVGRAAALREIKKALNTKTFEQLKEAVTAYATAMKGADPQFIPHCATWMSQGRYDDDRADWKHTGKGSGKANGYTKSLCRVEDDEWTRQFEASLSGGDSPGVTD